MPFAPMVVLTTLSAVPPVEDRTFGEVDELLVVYSMVCALLKSTASTGGRSNVDISDSHEATTGAGSQAGRRHSFGCASTRVDVESRDYRVLFHRHGALDRRARAIDRRPRDRPGRWRDAEEGVEVRRADTLS